MPCRMVGDEVQATMPCHMQSPVQKEKHPQAEELRKAGRCALLQYLRSVRIAHEQSVGAKGRNTYYRQKFSQYLKRLLSLTFSGKQSSHLNKQYPRDT